MRPAHAADARIGAGPGRRRRCERYGGFGGSDFLLYLGPFRGLLLAFSSFLLLLLAPGVGALVRLTLALPFCFGLRGSLSSLVGSCFRGSRVLLLLGGSSFLFACLLRIARLFVRYSLLSLLRFLFGLGDLFVRLGAR